jgi:hypothetical protein
MTYNSSDFGFSIDGQLPVASEPVRTLRDLEVRGRLLTTEAFNLFAFAGNATFTLVSKKTGARYTYRIRAADGKGKVTHFVSLLNGSDNEGDFAYLGHFFGPDYTHGKKSRVGFDAPSARAFAWFAAQLKKPGALPESLEVWHEGRCGACNRKLTVPESVASGIGPECAKRLGVARIVCDDPFGFAA